VACDGYKLNSQKGIRWMRVCHGVTATFDDPNLVSCAGLAPVLELAERAGLQGLVGEHVRIARPGGGNAHLKVPALVAGMIAGADSIEDMGLLRHGAMNRLFTGVRAPSTLGTFLRTFTFGHVRQLDAVASRLLTNLCTSAPLLPGAHQLSYVDIDDTVKPTFGYAKQGAGRGYTGVKGLNVLLGIISTPNSRPVIAAARLRKGSTNSTKGAHRFVADTLITARSCGATGTLVLRADSAFYQCDVIASALRRKACFSITARQLPPVRKEIESIAEDAWTPIKYTNAIWHEDSHQWISEAEVAEIAFTAFTSKAKAKQVTARLIVRRVPDVNPAHQSPLFTVYRYQLGRPGARCRDCSRPVSPGRPPNRTCGSHRIRLSMCLGRWSTAYGCRSRCPWGCDVRAAVAVADHPDAGSAREHNPATGESPAPVAEAPQLTAPDAMFAPEPPRDPAPRVGVDRGEGGF